MNENLVGHLTSLKEEQTWTQFQTPCLFHFDLQTFVTLISLTFITISLFVLLRSPGHFHSERRSKFRILSIKIDNHGSLRSPTQPALRTSCFFVFFFLLIFVIPNTGTSSSEHPVFFLMSGKRNELRQQEIVMREWCETSATRGNSPNRSIGFGPGLCGSYRP